MEPDNLHRSCLYAIIFSALAGIFWQLGTRYNFSCTMQWRNQAWVDTDNFNNLCKTLRYKIFLISSVEAALNAQGNSLSSNHATVITWGIIRLRGFGVENMVKDLELGGAYSCSQTSGTLPPYVNRDYSWDVPFYIICSTGWRPRVEFHVVVFYRHTSGYLWFRAHPSAAPVFSTRPAHDGYGRLVSPPRIRPVSVSIDHGTVATMHLPRNRTAFITSLAGNESRFVPCDEAAAAAYRRRVYRGEPATSKEALFADVAAAVLRRAARVLDEAGVPFWLSSGTCLGWARECAIIRHTTDVDLGIRARDYPGPELVRAMKTAGFHLKHVFGRSADSFELSFEWSGVKLDLFFFYEEVDAVGRSVMWNGGTDVSEGGAKLKYVFPRFELCRAELLGVVVRVPCDVDTYLEANYGPAWRSPVKEWDWRTSPPNVRPNGAWRREELAEVMQVY